jgi:ABC-type Fe3+-hydroxamate transport system substrate-binding protein
MFRRLLPAALLVLLACGKPAPAAAIRDDLNRPVLIPAHVRRVVTLAPNMTEMVYAVGSGSLIVATDDFSDFPPEAKKLPKVGGMQPSIELIAKAKPDLVIATTNGNHASLAPALSSAGLPLFVLASERLDQIPRAMDKIGTLLASPRRAAAVAALRRSIEQQRRTRTRKARVLMVLWTSPMYIAGRKTFMDDLLVLCGAVNAAPEALTGWPQYSLETFVANPPDLLLYPKGSVSPRQIDELLARVPEWRATHQAVAIDENRFTRPGPRLGEAAAELNAILDGWERSH